MPGGGQRFLYSHADCPSSLSHYIEFPGEHVEGVTFPDGYTAPEEIKCSVTGLPMQRMDLTDPERELRFFAERDERAILRNEGRMSRGETK